jgi:hypothetical protein
MNMAKLKSKPVEGEIQQPDFEGALRVYNTDIRPAKSAQKSAMQEAGIGWKHVVKELKVNKPGFEKAMVVAEMEEADQQSWLRAFNSGLQLRGVSLHIDMVDVMEGNVNSNVVPIEAGRADNLSSLDVPEGGEEPETDGFDDAAPFAVAAE